MNKQNYKIHIVGAGVSGLIAAKVLEEHGYNPIIIEATERAGGRVKTDVLQGYQLDHGFQVLLTGYPAAKKHLNFNSLELQKFLPGASIFKNNQQKIIGDPLRDISLLSSTLFSGIGNFSDKLKVLKLNMKLKKKKIETIFSEKEQTTLSYLEDFGFSNEMINDFFKPFFSGIFLEEKLDTSSRMFEFIYKMFGEGYASIPAAGMEAIPKQLKQNLKNTTFRFHTKVSAVKENEIILDDNTILKSDYTIIATEASNLIENKKIKPTEWKSCQNLYFETSARVIQKKLIGLIPKKGTLINNIVYTTCLKTKGIPNKELLSVTVINKQKLSDKILIDEVIKELKEHCNIDNIKFLKQYNIPMALPRLNNVKYEIPPSELKVSKSIFLAGDTLVNGSLNAAIISGESAAMGIIEANN